MSEVAALHGLDGTALLLTPGLLLREAGDPVGRRARLVARLLGARHLGQAALLAASGRRATRFGAAVDGLHAASMLGLGLAMPPHRRAAIASGAAAIVLAALELAEADHG